MSEALEEREGLGDEWTPMVAHDMRNFLTVIRANAEVQERDGEKAPREKCIEDILESTGKLEWMIKDILDFKKMKDGRFPLAREHFQARELLYEVTRIKSADIMDRNIQLQVDVFLELEPVFADYRILRGDLDNFLTNAMEHMVIDGGKIFEKYFTYGKKKGWTEGGSGLGLAFCEAVARAHGGRISVESKVGEGSCFTLFLPWGMTHESGVI